MNVGDYVRTKYGIRKIIQIDNETTSKIRCYVLDKFYNECKICSSNYIYDEDIIKSSPNIIELIEVGDYVNGSKVVDISKIGKDKEKWVWVEQTKDTDYKYGDEYVGYNNDQIKSIVTKEQFESIEYKVKE